MDVANVAVEAGEISLSAVLVRKTRAKPGAGTGTEQVLADVSHGTVVTFSVPESRPSASKSLPNVCFAAMRLKTREKMKRERTWPAQVKFACDETDSAKRYL